MYGIYANIWGILMVNVTIYTIHGSYGWWVKIRQRPKMVIYGISAAHLQAPEPQLASVLGQV